MKLLFYSKPLVVPVLKDWANGQFLSGASQPQALVIGGHESQLALGSACRPLGSAAQMEASPSDCWEAGGLLRRQGFKLMRLKCEPHCCLVSMFPEACPCRAPF